MKKWKTLFGLLVLIFLAGCIAGPNPSFNVPDAKGHLAGFWLGLWHGSIIQVTFIISLFTNKVHFYEVHNSGAGYDVGILFGFVLSWFTEIIGWLLLVVIWNLLAWIYEFFVGKNYSDQRFSLEK